MIQIPSDHSDPAMVIADLYGQRPESERLVKKLEMLAEWSDSALVLPGDFVDQGTEVPGTIVLVIELHIPRDVWATTSVVGRSVP